MDTPQLQNRIRELQREVAPFSLNKDSSRSFYTSYKIYGIIPIVILILLIILRPSFLYNEKPDSKQRSFSFQKLFLYWLILSFLFIVGIFGYNYTHRE